MQDLNTIFGVILAIIAGAMFVVGAVLQKKGVQDMPDIKLTDVNTMTPLLKNRYWLAGIIIGSAGGLPYVISQNMIGIGYTQLLIATGLILLAIMASRMLKEPLGKVEYTGISLLVLGTVFLGLAQLQPVPTGLLLTPDFFINALIFFIIFYSVIAVGMIYYKKSDRGVAKNLGILSGIFFGCGACFSQIGMLGFNLGYWWLVIFGFLLLIVGNLIGTLVANVAFQKGKAILVIPLQSIGNYLLPVLAGLTLFQQIFAVGSEFWFIPSIILIMLGVFFLSRIQAEMEESEIPDANSTPDASSS